VLNSVVYFTNGVANFLKTAGHPQVDAVWFSGPSSPYASVRSIAVTMLLCFLLLSILTGLLHGDVSGMLRRMAGTLPASVAGMVVAPEIVSRLLDLTDALSTAVLTNSGGDAVGFLSHFDAFVISGAGGFGALVIGMFAIVSALLLWVELMLRSALVYFLVALSPLAFAAMVWPSARGVLRRLVELLVGVIFSKLVICIALAVGAAALGNTMQAVGSSAGAGNAAAAGLGSLLTGTTLLVLASWSPFILMRMIPIAESAVIAQGISRGPARAAMSGVGTVSSVNSVGRLAGGNSSPGRSASASPSRNPGTGQPGMSKPTAVRTTPTQKAK
jgi:hypothetical protein